MSEPNTPPVPPIPPAQNTPPAPPAPPAAPAAQPAPQYGEFAPAAPAAPATPVVPAAPAAPAMPAPATPPAAAPAYTQPQYPGATQGAYPGAAPAAPVYGQPGFNGAPVGPRRRTWDLILTIILLVLGLGGLLGGLFYAWAFTQAGVLDEAFRQQGLSGFSGDASGSAAIIAISHIALYVIAAGVSILLLLKKKIAFYVPLIAGVIATVIFWGTLMTMLMSEPSFSNLI